MIIQKKPSEIEKMRKAGKLTGDALKMIEEHVREGVTTLELNRKIDEFIRSNGAYPSFYRYRGYPASACISVNDVVVHGIPSAKIVLTEGDIVSIDVGVLLNGWQGDAARTFAVGKISAQKKQLIEVTKQSFFEGIKHARAGKRVGDISCAIQNYAESFGYGVVREMVGHGIGKNMHEDPSIPNYGVSGTGAVLKSGYALAIEPMINLKSAGIKFDDDGWTCRTIDGHPSAHYENTVVVTYGEPEILTL